MFLFPIIPGVELSSTFQNLFLNTFLIFFWSEDFFFFFFWGLQVVQCKTQPPRFGLSAPIYLIQCEHDTCSKMTISGSHIPYGPKSTSLCSSVLDAI